jgi:hypothetical protein
MGEPALHLIPRPVFLAACRGATASSVYSVAGHRRARMLALVEAATR